MRWFAALLLGALSCAAHAQETGNDLARAVREFVAASNRQDIEAMVKATAEDFRWFQVVGERTTVEVVGHTDLRSWLGSYFAATPTARSQVGPVAVNGLFASTVETTSYTSREGRHVAQSATSVYEFAPDGRIRHVWYFNAQPVAGAALDDE